MSKKLTLCELPVLAKKEEIEFGSGRGKRMTTEVILYFELPFQQKRNFDWSPTCLQQKRLSPKGVQFSQRLFAGRMANRNVL